jgi:hypothetical protein
MAGARNPSMHVLTDYPVRKHPAMATFAVGTAGVSLVYSSIDTSSKYATFLSSDGMGACR